MGIPRLVLVIAAVLSMAIVITVAVAVLMTRVLHGPVTDERLGISVGHVTGGGTTGDCTPARVDDHLVKGRWSCGVWIDAGSNGLDYTVQMKPGSSCWTAWRPDRRSIDAGDLPMRADGCVRRWEWDPLGLSAS